VTETNPAKNRPAKAIVLLSGGLDSALAIRLMLNQGIAVLAVNFVGIFCTCGARQEGGGNLAIDVAQSMNVPIRVLPMGMDFMRIVEHPRHGRGRGVNPCIDCRIFMLRRAAQLMDEESAAFVVTGEVLGQRPMSQHRQALDLVERESGIAGRILRPLCAQLLEPTQPERDGLVDRARLLAIRGRSRQEQLALAKELKVEVFGPPAGGCLLTDPAIARRVKDLFAHCPDYDMNDAEAATFGRHYRLHEELKVILGRSEQENDRLQRLAGARPLAEIAGRPGPLALVRGVLREGDRERIGRILRAHGKHGDRASEKVCWLIEDREEYFTAHGVASEDELARWKI